MSVKYAAICDGRNPHFLDHFAPLNCPILTDNEDLLKYKAYYPRLNLQIKKRIEEYAAYDYLITSSKQAGPELSALLRIPCIFLPHGYSDKPPTIFEPQTHAFIYGPAMAAQIAHLSLHAIPLPNIRYAYYLKHQTFFDNLVPIDRSRKTLLYAPTWDHFSSFKYHFNTFLPIPRTHNLIIKCHPFLEHTHPAHVIYLQELAKTIENLYVFTHFPIYPLMAAADSMITDHSSVAYEFLTFERPLYFLSKGDTPLHQCGPLITPSYYQDIPDVFATKRQDLARQIHFNSFKTNDLFKCKAALHL